MREKTFIVFINSNKLVNQIEKLFKGKISKKTVISLENRVTHDPADISFRNQCKSKQLI